MIRTMLSEAMWGRLAPLLPPQKPRTGRPSLDHRRFLEAVLWLARPGTPRRDLARAGEMVQRLAPPPALPRRRRLGPDCGCTSRDVGGRGLGRAPARQHRRPAHA